MTPVLALPMAAPAKRILSEKNLPSKRDYLSYSAVRTYLQCPLRYMFRYVQGLPEKLVAASLLFGSGIHAALEAHFRALMIGEVLGLDELLGAFLETWDSRQPDEIRFGKGEDLESIANTAERMLHAFLVSDLAKPKGRIIGVEEELRGPVFSDLPDLLARLDLIVDTGDAVAVTDFKSSRSQWDADQAVNAADQLLLYSELVHDIADGRPIRLEFMVFTKTKVPSITSFPIEYDRRHVARTKRIVEGVWHAIECQHFYPNPSYQCATCPFRKPCSEWKGFV